MTPSERMQTRHWRTNFLSALAAFIREEMPVDDSMSAGMNDTAWLMARALEDDFLAAFEAMDPDQK